jgi:hypothetical protein
MYININIIGKQRRSTHTPPLFSLSRTTPPPWNPSIFSFREIKICMCTCNVTHHQWNPLKWFEAIFSLCSTFFNDPWLNFFSSNETSICRRDWSQGTIDAIVQKFDYYGYKAFRCKFGFSESSKISLSLTPWI